MLDIISASVRIATPILLAAMGGILCFRAGVFNIGLEGLMLIGSFAGIAGVMFGGGSVWIGFLISMIAGVLVAGLYAYITVHLHANQIVVGIAINLLALGLTSFLLKSVFHTSGALHPEHINKLTEIELPLIGLIIGKQSIITYFAIVAVFIIQFVLKRTHIGIAIQSSGEAPETGITCGIRVNQIRVAMILLSGALCGLAGSYLSTVSVSEFTENMTSGRGFTAFTAMAFSNANPVVTSLVSLLLGFADAMGIRLEIRNIGVPSSIIKMFPYILALVVYFIGSALRNTRTNRKNGTAVQKRKGMVFYAKRKNQ